MIFDQSIVEELNEIHKRYNVVKDKVFEALKNSFKEDYLDRVIQTGNNNVEQITFHKENLTKFCLYVWMSAECEDSVDDIEIEVFNILCDFESSFSAQEVSTSFQLDISVRYLTERDEAFEEYFGDDIIYSIA